MFYQVGEWFQSYAVGKSRRNISELMDIRPDSANVERRLWAEREAQAEEDMRAWGVEVTTLSEAEMQKFRAAVRPMYERLAEQAELIRQIQEA